MTSVKFHKAGSISDTGRHVERAEAERIALAAGQTEALKWKSEVYSEVFGNDGSRNVNLLVIGWRRRTP